MLKKVFDLLTKDQKKKLFYYQILFVIQGFLEAIGVVSIIPLIYAITTPSKEELMEKLFFAGNYLKDFDLQEIQLFFILLFIIYITFLNFIISFNFIITERLVRNVYNSLFVKLLDKYFIFSPKNLSKFELSEKINTLTYDLQQSSIYIFQSVYRNFSKVYSLFFIFMVMLMIDFYKSIIFLIFFLIIYFLIFRKLGKNLELKGKKSSDKNLKIFKNIKEIFGNLKTIHIDNLNDVVVPKLITDANTWALSRSNLQINSFLLKIFAELLAMLVILFLIFYMLINSQQDVIFATIGFYVYGFYRAFPNMQSIFGAFVIYRGWSKVLDKVINETEDNLDKIVFGDEQIKFSDRIKIENLLYIHDDDTHPIIKNLNLEIKKGTILGIKGPSGSGKTTLVDIISGIKFPTKGSIKVDSLNLNLKTLSSWFKKISYVPQKLFFFNESVENNIIINNKNIHKKDLFKILKIVELENLLEIKNDPNLNTVINELNTNISGGEAQRLAIARALVKNPELLILDETTSGIQIEMEKKIINNIKLSFPKITIILISHRDKSLEICEKVIKF